MKINVKATIKPVSALRIIQLPWWLGTSFTRCMPHLKDKKGGKYCMNKKKNCHILKLEPN